MTTGLTQTQVPPANVTNWDDLNCFRLDISMWSGRAKLTREDLKDPNAVPPEALASLGNLKLIDPDQLKIFNALKRRACRACEARGSAFLGGYVVSKQSVATLDEELSDIRNDYSAAVSKLVQDYDTKTKAWMTKNPQWSHILQPRMPSASDVERRFAFGWTIFKVAPSSEANGTHGSGELLKANLSIGDTVIDDISKALKECWRSSFADVNKTEYGTKAFNGIDKAITKCSELAFTNPKLGVLCKFLNDLKAFGKLGNNLSAFRAVFSAATSPDSIRNILDMAEADVTLSDMAWALQPNLMPAQPVATPEVAPLQQVEQKYVHETLETALNQPVSEDNLGDTLNEFSKALAEANVFVFVESDGPCVTIKNQFGGLTIPKADFVNDIENTTKHVITYMKQLESQRQTIEQHLATPAPAPVDPTPEPVVEDEASTEQYDGELDLDRDLPTPPPAKPEPVEATPQVVPSINPTTPEPVKDGASFGEMVSSAVQSALSSDLATTLAREAIEKAAAETVMAQQDVVESILNDGQMLEEAEQEVQQEVQQVQQDNILGDLADALDENAQPANGGAGLLNFDGII